MGQPLRGHHVVVLERRDRRGGRARLAAERKGRERWRLYIDWLGEEASDAGVEIRLGAEATVAAVVAERPDAVILATGSTLRDRVPSGGTPLYDVDTLLEHGVPAGGASRRALVLDDEGGFLAPTAAEALVTAGFTVEIATKHTSVGLLIDPTQQPFVLRRLGLAHVVQTPNLEWVPSESFDVIQLRDLYTEEVERRNEVDLVVMAGRRRGDTAYGTSSARRPRRFRRSSLATRSRHELCSTPLRRAPGLGRRSERRLPSLSSLTDFEPRRHSWSPSDGAQSGTPGLKVGRGGNL